MQRMRVLPTTIGARSYVSLTKAEDPSSYALITYAYEGEAKAELRVGWPKVGFFAQAVLDGVLPGEVKGDSEDLDERKVRIDVPTNALRAWIEKHADEAFQLVDKPLRRVAPATSG